MLKQSDLEKVGRMLADRYGIRVICGGVKCSTNGNTIYLPSLPEQVDNPKLLSLVRYFLDHECGHMVGESDFDCMESYTKISGKHAAAILDVLEDCRVEQIMSDIWAGCGINLRLGIKELLERWETSDDDESKLHPLKQLLTSIYVHAKGLPNPSWVTDEVKQIVDNHSLEIQEIPLNYKSTKALMPLATTIYNEYVQLANQDDSQGDGQEDGDENGQEQGNASGSGKPRKSDGQLGDGSPSQNQSGDAGENGNDVGDDSPENGDNDTDNGQSPEQQDKSTADDGQNELADESFNRSRVSGRGADHSEALPLPEQFDNVDIDDLKVNASREIADAVDDELDDMSKNIDDIQKLHRPLLPDMHKLVDFVPPSRYRLSDSFVQQFIKDAKRIGGPMQQKLRQLLLVEERTWWRSGMKKGTPDPRRLAGLATGIDDRVMRRRIEHEAPNTACHLLIDGSGSMDKIIKDAMLAATAFMVTLEGCGHKTSVSVFQCTTVGKMPTYDVVGIKQDDIVDAVTGGQSYTDMPLNEYHELVSRSSQMGLDTDCVALLRVKRWGESVNSALPKMAQACILNDGGTPLGEALMVAAKDLAKRSEKRKVLMAFTDGAPNDRGYARYVCKYCESNGIEVVLIGIMSRAVENLHHRHAVVDNINDLNKTTMVELTKALHPKHG